MNRLTETEILKRLKTAGRKRKKQLIIKLVKLHGGCPIKHLLDPSDGETEWGGTMCLEESYSQIMGFSENHWNNIRTGEGGDTYTSLTGRFSESTIKQVLAILR